VLIPWLWACRPVPPLEAGAEAETACNTTAEVATKLMAVLEKEAAGAAVDGGGRWAAPSAAGPIISRQHMFNMRLGNFSICCKTNNWKTNLIAVTHPRTSGHCNVAGDLYIVGELTLLPQEHEEINGFRIRELFVLLPEHLMDVGL
jgi:hypothetical protein